MWGLPDPREGRGWGCSKLGKCVPLSGWDSVGWPHATAIGESMKEIPIRMNWDTGWLVKHYICWLGRWEVMLHGDALDSGISQLTEKRQFELKDRTALNMGRHTINVFIWRKHTNTSFGKGWGIFLVLVATWNLGWTFSLYITVMICYVLYILKKLPKK